MHLSDIQFIFNRAMGLTFEKSKWLLTFIVLAIAGLLVVFCRGLAAETNVWVAMSLTFLPLFLCAGVLLSLGVVLIRGYHDEVKKLEVNYKKILSESWETLLGASYFTVPVILLYLMLWMLLGVFMLLQNIPAIGDFVSVILAFAPFLLNFATLLLCIFVVGTLFFVTPVIALKGLSRSLVSQVLMRRVQGDIFSNMVLFIVAMIPLIFYIGLLMGSAFLTGSICTSCNDTIHTVLQWFFIMLPFTALLAPAVIFFFNFAAESHVFMQKKLKA